MHSMYLYMYVIYQHSCKDVVYKYVQRMFVCLYCPLNTLRIWTSSGGT